MKKTCAWAVAAVVALQTPAALGQLFNSAKLEARQGNAVLYTQTVPIGPVEISPSDPSSTFSAIYPPTASFVTSYDSHKLQRFDMRLVNRAGAAVRSMYGRTISSMENLGFVQLFGLGNYSEGQLVLRMKARLNGSFLIPSPGHHDEFSYASARFSVRTAGNQIVRFQSVYSDSRIQLGQRYQPLYEFDQLAVAEIPYTMNSDLQFSWGWSSEALTNHGLDSPVARTLLASGTATWMGIDVVDPRTGYTLIPGVDFETQPYYPPWTIASDDGVFSWLTPYAGSRAAVPEPAIALSALIAGLFIRFSRGSRRR